VLEEVQVPIAFGHCVVNRVPTGDLRVGKAAAGDKVNLDRQRLGLRVEVDFPDEPRIAYAKGCFKQFAMHRSCCSLPETRHDTTHLKFKRGNICIAAIKGHSPSPTRGRLCVRFAQATDPCSQSLLSPLWRYDTLTSATIREERELRRLRHIYTKSVNDVPIIYWT